MSPGRDTRHGAAPDAAPDLRLWGWALRALQERPDDTLGLEVYLPFCARHCLYCGHDIETGTHDAAQLGYAAAVQQEMDLVAGHLGHACDVVQVHFGGGTPNHLPREVLADLVDTVRRRFHVLPETEWSIECDPGRASEAQMQALRGMGFTQLRLGLADLDPQVQAAAGRVQSAALLHDAMAMARGARLRSVQLDLVCGLPLQNAARWRATLHGVLALGPDRILCLPYRHQPQRFWNQCAISRDLLPGADEVQAMWALAVETFTAAGYRWIGGDLFVLEDDPLAQAAASGELHCSALGHGSLPVHHLLAFGAGRTSDVADTLATSEPCRPLWVEALGQGRWPLAATCRRSVAQRQRRCALQRLRCTLGLSADDVGEAVRSDWERLADTAALGWVEREGDVLRITPAGRLRLDALCTLFDDAGTPPAPPAPPRWTH